MIDAHRTYLPAAGHDWTLPLYDPMVRLMGGDAARRRLIEQAGLGAGDRVLEIGCGTGSLLTVIARTHAAVDITGLDPDPKALARARRKADAISAPVRLDRGFSDALPYPEGSFDRVFSCFMLHHLADADEKLRTIREAARVLEPGGRLHVLDFAQPDGHASRLATWMHSSRHLADNSEERMLSLLRDGGLDAATAVGYGRMSGLLRLAYYRAVRR